MQVVLSILGLHGRSQVDISVEFNLGLEFRSASLVYSVKRVHWEHQQRRERVSRGQRRSTWAGC